VNCEPRTVNRSPIDGVNVPAYLIGMSTSYFAGCTVLITGASAGIGREFARQLAPVVGSMILVARRADRLEALELELKVINPDLEIFYRGLDLRNHDDLAKFCDWLEESGLAVDLLINNAGLGDQGHFVDSDWDKVNAMLSVNIEALTYLTYRILPSMQKSGCGAILNVSSVAGFLPVPTLAVYAASKAYVTSFSEALRAELRSSNISVTVLCPGPVATEFSSVAARSGAERLSPPDFITVPVQRVVQTALASVARDRPRLVPGIALRMLITLILFAPMFIKRLVYDLQLRREGAPRANLRPDLGAEMPSHI
jgi:short-subunit dehydrogenase